MQPHEERVVIEQKELLDKLKKLREFIDSNRFHELPYDEQGRLKIQKFLMEEYSAVLLDRIDNAAAASEERRIQHASETYLGDGVYAHYTKFGELVLTTGANRIVLEPQVLSALLEYAAAASEGAKINP